MQSLSGLNNIFSDNIDYILNNIHCLKCGEIISCNDKKAKVDFHISQNKNNEKNNLIVLEFEFMQSCNINFEYEAGDIVVVGFFDDNEELFINNNQKKVIDMDQTIFKHALSNGYVLFPIKKKNSASYITFKDGIEIFTKKLIDIKNDKTNLSKVFEKVSDAINTISNAVSSLVITAPNGSCSITPTAYQQQIAQAKTMLDNEFKKLLK